MAKVYCLYDTVAEESGPLFEARNDVIASRILEAIENLPKGASKDDFRVIRLGYYDHGENGLMPAIRAHDKGVEI